jgi:hypothetical protein
MMSNLKALQLITTNKIIKMSSKEISSKSFLKEVKGPVKKSTEIFIEKKNIRF